MRQANISCPSCKCQAVRFVERHNDYVIYGCEGCTLEFCDPMKPMSAAEYESTEGYDQMRLLGGQSRESVLWWGHRQFIKEAHKLIPKTLPRKLLDIGCGTGAFVDYALEAGFDAYGVDFDRFSVEVAWGTERLKKRVFYADTKDIHGCVGSSRFDVVTFFEVLEHVPDIHLFLSQMRALLAPNGVIALCVPVADRWSLRTQEREPADYPPNHLTRWTVKALRVLMKNTDFDVLSIRESPVSFGLYRLATGTRTRVENAANRTPNGVRNPSSSTLVEKSFGLAVTAKQVLLTPILSAIGVRGDRVLVIARPRQ